MKQTVTTRRTRISGAAASVLILDFVEINEKAARLPCRIVDNSRCLSLDRFDPTCPQCM
jgi:hypothetical protein